MVRAAHLALRQIYRPGYQLIKAGGILLDLAPDDAHQGVLDLID